MAPTKPSTKPFSELAKTLGDHLDPSPQEWESGFVLDVVFKLTARGALLFVAELRRLSLHCGYGENLSTALRDQFVLGLRSEATQKKLVMIKYLKLDLAVQTTNMDETATRDTGTLHGHPSGAGSCAWVHKLHTSQKTNECEIRERTPTCVTCAMGEITRHMTVDSRKKHVIGVAN